MIEAKAASTESAAPVRLYVVDSDVHHGYESPEQLHPYLTKVYRERLRDFGLPSVLPYSNLGGVLGNRADLPLSRDPSMYREILLDGAGVDVALLTGSFNAATTLTDADYAAALCRACNSYSVEVWLQFDPRFRLAISIPTQDPDAAAREIDRLASHNQVVAVLLPCGAPKPYGQRFYHPIHEACARNNLVMALHFGTEGAGINPPPTAAGWPAYYVESRPARPAFYQVHLASFIFEGVFETFPDLKVALLEGGFGWVPSYVWRMDADWRALRRETPWVKRAPSEYVRKNIRFGSQPIEETDPPDALLSILDWMYADETLLFCSDFPHFDWDEPKEAFKDLPLTRRERILSANAIETFRR